MMRTHKKLKEADTIPCMMGSGIQQDQSILGGGGGRLGKFARYSNDISSTYYIEVYKTW